MKSVFLHVFLFILLSACGADMIRNEYYANGALKEKCQFVNGLKNGVCTMYYDNGNISVINNWKHDTLHGKAIGYFSCGSIRFEATYYMGVLDGFFISYYKNGNIEKKGNWEKGNRVGLHKEFYSNGQAKVIYQFYVIEFKSHLNQSIHFSEYGDTLYEKSTFFRYEINSDTLTIGDTLLVEFNFVSPLFEKNSEFYFFFDLPEEEVLMRRLYSEVGVVVYDYVPINIGLFNVSGYIEEFVILEEKTDSILGKSAYYYFDIPYWVLPGIENN